MGLCVVKFAGLGPKQRFQDTYIGVRKDGPQGGRGGGGVGGGGGGGGGGV